MKETVILVDKNDNQIGIEEKIAAHNTGKLHRAFSIFILRHERMLLQRRASSKYHSGGQWTDACDGHPRPGETIQQAARRRLRTEMGFDCNLKEVFSFIYEAPMENGLTEHEFDHILMGSFDGEVKPNPEEVESTKWIETNSLLDDLRVNPQNYAVWFRLAMEKFPEGILAR